MILNVAAGGLVSNFRPVLAALGDRFGLQAAVIDPYFGQAAAEAALKISWSCNRFNSTSIISCVLN